MRLATQARIQNGTCSQGFVETSSPVPRSPVPVWLKRCWLERWDPCGAGRRSLSALLYEQMGCLGQKSAAFGSSVLGCNGLQMIPSPPLPGRKSSGTEAVPSLCARVGVLVLAWRRRQSCCKHTAGKLQVFSALIFMIFLTKRAPFKKRECSCFCLPDITTGRAGSFKCVLVSSYKTKFGQQHVIFAKGFMLALWHRRGGSRCLVLTGGHWGCGLQQSHC